MQAVEAGDPESQYAATYQMAEVAVGELLSLTDE